MKDTHGGIIIVTHGLINWANSYIKTPKVGTSIPKFLILENILHVILKDQFITSGPSQGLKIRGARSNVVSIMCPPLLR